MPEPVGEQRNARAIDQRSPEKLEGICQSREAEVSDDFQSHAGIAQPCRQRVENQKVWKPCRKPQEKHHHDPALRENTQRRSHVSLGGGFGGRRYHRFRCIRRAGTAEMYCAGGTSLTPSGDFEFGRRWEKFKIGRSDSSKPKLQDLKLDRGNCGISPSNLR